MRLRSASFGARNESCADPHGLSTPRKVSSERTTVVYGTCAYDIDRLAGQRGLVSLDSIDAGRDEDRGGDVTGVSSTLTSLSADEVDAGGDGFWYVLGVTNHLYRRLEFA